MAATAYLLDTNILLRLSQPGGPYDEVVAAAVERLTAAISGPSIESPDRAITAWLDFPETRKRVAGPP